MRSTSLNSGHDPARIAVSRRQQLLHGLKTLVTTLLRPQVSTASRERRDLLLLLIAVALVTTPHFATLPWWALGALLTLWILRLGLTLAQQPTPSARWTWPLLAVVAIAVYAEYRSWFGAAAGVLFLLLLMGLKLLEMRARRDVFVVIFLCFFILLTLFLQGQGLGVAALALLAVLLLFFVLTSVNLGETDLPAGTKFKLVGVIFLKALPLALVFFVLFPRLSGPLWGLPTADGSARTGLSTTMSPGSVARLLESEAVAFRVQFEGLVPPSHLMYWRGPTFGFFNGRAWSGDPSQPQGPTPALSVVPSSGVGYNVTLEPHTRDWLFALELPQLSEYVGPNTVRLTSEGQVIADKPITQRVRYRLRSYTRFVLGAQATRDSLRYALQLPTDFNPRTVQYAENLRLRLQAQHPGVDPQAATQALIDAVLQLFRSGGFRYTLEPRGLGRDSVDEFLFETHEGYCEHYASAFVTLMRAMGVAARVVTGYQGGELNPVDGFVTVRQSDAHAWAEVWLGDKGWVRVDPTAVVAPDRAAGRAGARADQGDANLRNIAAFHWMRQAFFNMRFNWEALQNTWNQWVLSYSPDRQRALLERLGFEADMHVLGKLLALALTVMLSFLAWLSLRHRVVRDPLGEAYAQLRRRLTKAGVNAHEHLGPRTLTQALQPLQPSSRDQAHTLLQRYETLRYSRASRSAARDDIKAFARAVARFQPLKNESLENASS